MLLPLVALAIPVGLLGIPRRGRMFALGILLIPAFHFVTRFRTGWSAREPRDIALLLLSAFACCFALVLLGRRSRALGGIGAGVLALLWLVALQRHAWSARGDYARESYQLHPHIKYWAERSALLDEPGETHVIAITSGPTQGSTQWFGYYFLGRRFQNRLLYVPPSRGGEVVSFSPDWLERAQPDKRVWIHRLTARGVTAVMSFIPRSVELEWMAETPENFERIAGGYKWGLYRFHPTPGLPNDPER
jgi:hypothetical protein